MIKVTSARGLTAEVSGIISDATTEVFSTMLGIDEMTMEALPPPHDGTSPGGGIFSIIGMAGAWAGTTSLVCSAEFACRVSSRFLQTPLTTVDADVLDAMAELTNMIGGTVKTVLEEALGEMRLSTPTVISGEKVQAHCGDRNDWTMVRFRCQDGELYVQVHLTPNDGAAHLRLRPGVHLPRFLTHA